MFFVPCGYFYILFELFEGALLRLKPSRIHRSVSLRFAPRRAVLFIYTALPCILGRVVCSGEGTIIGTPLRGVDQLNVKCSSVSKFFCLQ
jgi:hypothetical protein